MTIDEIISTREGRIEAGRESFKYFLMIYFQESLNYPFAEFHDSLFEDLEDDDLQYLLIVMFREAAKSFICGIAFVVWYTVYKKGTYVVVASDEEKAAKNILGRVIHQFQNNALLINDFGQMYYEKKERHKVSKKKTDGHFETSNNVTFLARGAGQKVRGALGNDIRRPDLLITDDLESLKTCMALDQRNKLFKWFNSEAVAATNQTSGRAIVLANMLHKDGFCIRLKNTGIWKTHWVPVEKDGKLAWPDRWAYTKEEADEYNKTMPKEEWKTSIEEAKQKYGTHIFNTEFMLNPLDDGQTIIMEEWIQYYSQEVDYKNRDKFKIVMAVDPAVKLKEHNDFTAIAVMAKEKVTNNMYLLDYVNKRLKFSDIKTHIHLLDKAYNPSFILVEDVAAQHWLIQELKDMNLPVKGVGRRTDKRSRLISVSAKYEYGLVYFRKNQHEVVNQITTFTGNDKEGHDDLVDAVTDCISFLSKKSPMKGFKNKGIF